jgi:hypothetical protein
VEEDMGIPKETPVEVKVYWNGATEVKDLASYFSGEKVQKDLEFMKELQRKLSGPEPSAE